MDSDENELNALAELLIPVLASVQSCRTHEFWRKACSQIKYNDTQYVYGEYETIGDATMLFSLISLRKIDDFLSDEKKKRNTDVRYNDFGIGRKAVLLDAESIISHDVRSKINKCIAHFTDFGDPSVEDLEEFDQALEAAEPALGRLEEQILLTLKLIDQ